MSQGKKGRAKRLARGARFARVRQPRTPKLRVLIVGEGRETEPNYFRGVKANTDVKAKFVVDVRAGEGGSAEAAVQKASDVLGRIADEPYDHVFCVVDIEDTSRKETLERARQAAKAIDPQPQLILSNPSFECWLLAHFVAVSRSFDTKSIRRKLDKLWQRQFGCNYDRCDKRVYEKVCDHTDIAIANAKRVRDKYHGGVEDTADCNSSTEVYRLMEFLLGGAPM